MAPHRNKYIYGTQLIGCINTRRHFIKRRRKTQESLYNANSTSYAYFWKLKIHKTLIKTLMMRLQESLDTQNLTTNLIFVDMVDY